MTCFRDRVPGPERAIEDAAALSAQGLLFTGEEPLWTGGSLSVGAGRPDLIFVSYAPDVISLTHGDVGMSAILAYLRAVREARLETIVERMRLHPKVVIRYLDNLLAAKRVRQVNSADSQRASRHHVRRGLCHRVRGRLATFLSTIDM